MADPKHRLRPLLHSGVPYKVRQAIDEIIRRGDPELHDWVLVPSSIKDAAMSEYWRWEYDDTQELRHPSLEQEEALHVLAVAHTPLATKLRGELRRLCIELGSNRSHEPQLDVSMLGGLVEVEKLRLMPRDPENQWEWRQLMAEGPAKPLAGFASIAGMRALQHLTVIGGGGVDGAPLGELRRLDHVELVACDLATAHLAGTTAKTIALRYCPKLTAIELPASVEHVHLEWLPELTSITLAPGAKPATFEAIGAPRLEALPVAGKLVRERVPRTSMA